MTAADVGGGRAAGLRSSSAGRDFPQQAAEAEVFALEGRGKGGRTGEGAWGTGFETGVPGPLLHPAFTGCKQIIPGGRNKLKSISQMTPEVPRVGGN